MGVNVVVATSNGTHLVTMHCWQSLIQQLVVLATRVKRDQTPVVVLATRVKRDEDREQICHALGRKDLLSRYVFVLIY
jgi:hypothetical protein